MTKQPLDIIFMAGPQGSGKGTQSRLLAQKTGFFYWEMGAILRENHDFMLSTGQTVGDIIDQGFFLSDEQLMEIVGGRLKELPSDRGIIFDAIPRRIGQAKWLVEWLRKNNRTNLTTIFLHIPEEESFKRLLHRAEVEGRADDTPEKIQRRLDQYKEVTVPAQEYLKGETRFLDIDGMASVEEVEAMIDEALGIKSWAEDVKVAKNA